LDSEALYTAAKACKAQYEASVPTYDFAMRLRAPLEFINSDPLGALQRGSKGGDLDWPQRASVAMVFTTSYTEAEMSRLADTASDMVVGSVLVSVGKPIQSPLFELRGSYEAPMNWGTARLYLQRKAALAVGPPPMVQTPYAY